MPKPLSAPWWRDSNQTVSGEPGAVQPVRPGAVQDTLAACLHLITGIRRNMKNYLMPIADKIMLRKRFVIETVLDTLKCAMDLEHSRQTSPLNAMVHALPCLVAYAFRPGKPAIALSGGKKLSLIHSWSRSKTTSR